MLLWRLINPVWATVQGHITTAQHRRIRTLHGQERLPATLGRALRQRPQPWVHNQQQSHRPQTAGVNKHWAGSASKGSRSNYSYQAPVNRHSSRFRLFQQISTRQEDLSRLKSWQSCSSACGNKNPSRRNWRAQQLLISTRGKATDSHVTNTEESPCSPLPIRFLQKFSSTALSII